MEKTDYEADDLSRLSINQLLRIFEEGNFPWIAALPQFEAANASKHSWDNAPGGDACDCNVNRFEQLAAAMPVTREAVRELKERLTVSTLFGRGAWDCIRGAMNGLANLIPPENKDKAGAWSKANLRGFVNRLKERGAFPEEGVLMERWGALICNAETIIQLHKMDDAITGGLWNDTDTPRRPINTILVCGVRFRVVEEPAMTRFFPSAEAAMFLLTPTHRAQKLLRLGTVSVDKTRVGPRRWTLSATLELRDPFRHGLFVATTA